MKALGAEIWDFWQNGWPEGYYIDDTEIEAEDDKGNCLLDLAAKYDLAEFGVLCPDGTQAERMREAERFSYFFSKWKKAQTKETLVIEVDKSKTEQIKAQLKEMGIKVR